MKNFLISAGLVGAATAQLSSLPQCGQTCFTNMVNLNDTLGCASVANTIDCLCMNSDFGYGVRDCSAQFCPNGTDVTPIEKFVAS